MSRSAGGHALVDGDSTMNISHRSTSDTLSPDPLALALSMEGLGEREARRSRRRLAVERRSKAAHLATLGKPPCGKLASRFLGCLGRDGVAMGLLENYGLWVQSLVEGELEPRTDAQQELLSLVEQYRGTKERRPFTTRAGRPCPSRLAHLWVEFEHLDRYLVERERTLLAERESLGIPAAGTGLPSGLLMVANDYQPFARP